MLDEVLEKIPETFNMAEIMAKAAEKTPYVVVAVQECERMNILIREMRRSLKELSLGLKVRKRGVGGAPGMRLRKPVAAAGRRVTSPANPASQPARPPGAPALGTARHWPPHPRAGVAGAPGQETVATQAAPCRRRGCGRPGPLQRPPLSGSTPTGVHGAGRRELHPLAGIGATGP